MSVLANVDTMREMSAISLSEIAIKQTRGKLVFGKEELSLAIADLRLHILPYTEMHAQALFDLPLHHTDPFDRQIIAQALTEGIPVVTSDHSFTLYRGLKVIW